MVPLWGADGTPLGGCKGEALKYSKLMYGSSPSQRLPAVLLFLVRVSGGGKLALKHLEMVIQTFYLLPRGLSHSVVNLTKTSCLNELICFFFL